MADTKTITKVEYIVQLENGNTYVRDMSSWSYGKLLTDDMQKPTNDETGYWSVSKLSIEDVELDHYYKYINASNLKDLTDDERDAVEESRRKKHGDVIGIRSVETQTIIIEETA